MNATPKLQHRDASSRGHRRFSRPEYAEFNETVPVRKVKNVRLKCPGCLSSSLQGINVRINPRYQNLDAHGFLNIPDGMLWLAARVSGHLERRGIA